MVWSGGFGRRTTIFQKRFTDATTLMIKDNFRDEGRRFTEKDILKHIHKDGTVPGVVRLIASEDIEAPYSQGGKLLRTAGSAYRNGKTVHRVRTRLVLGSCGQRISRARSIGDLVRAIYDAVEGVSTPLMYTRILS